MSDRRLWSWQHAIVQSDLPPTTRHVLLTLAVHMNAMGESCYPSTATQARETGLSERTVVSHLDAAVRAGWLVRDRHGFGGRKWARNEYRAAWPAPAEGPDPGARGTEAGSVPGAEALNVAARGAEPDDREALKQVQSNYPLESPRESRRDRAAFKADPDDLAAWSAVKQGLARTRGAAWVRAWLDKLGLGLVAPNVVVLEAPSAFIAERVAQEAAGELARLWGRTVEIRLARARATSARGAA